MRKETGGTEKYCPYCKTLRVLKAKTSGAQKWYKGDIQYFKRDLTCQTCGHKFTTVELQEKHLNELFELRDALGDIKVNAEQYLVEASAASKSLEKLSTALSVLRALHLYEVQDENNDEDFEEDDDDED